MNQNKFNCIYRTMSTNCFAIDGRFWILTYGPFNINGRILLYAKEKIRSVPHLGNYIGVRG